MDCERMKTEGWKMEREPGGDGKTLESLRINPGLRPPKQTGKVPILAPINVTLFGCHEVKGRALGEP